MISHIGQVDRWYRPMMESVAEHAIIMLSSSGVIRDWNLGAELLFGYPKHEVLGRSFELLYTKKDVQDGVPTAELTRALTAGSVTDERWHEGQQGARFFAVGSTSAIRGNGDLLGFCKLIQDHSSRRAHELDLQSRYQRLQRAMHASSIGTFEWDSLSDIMTWDETLRDIYAMPPEATSRTYADWLLLVHVEDRAVTQLRLLDGVRNRSAVSCEFRIMTPRGVRWVDLHAQPLASPLSAVFVGTQVDITVRKEAHLTLKRVNAELERVTTIASHDMREPLRMISGFLGILNSAYGHLFDDKASRYLGFALDGSVRMQRLIDNVLEIARIEQSPSPKEVVSLADVVAETSSDLHKQILDAQAELRIDPLPEVVANRDECLRLFRNLLGNAIKYRRPDVPPLVIISATNRGGDALISVADNGIGIPTEDQGRLFSMFQRGPADRGVQGWGIGLSVCATIVSRNGGSIWVESSPGSGSSFFFTLPRPAQKDHV